MIEDVLSSVVKFNSQTAGRDRIFRLLQYGSRLVWWLMEKYRHDKDIVNRLKNLEYTLGTGRKLFRLGRGLDALYGALSTMNLPDVTLRITLTLSRINIGLYLLADHVLWLGRVGLAEVNKSKWSQISYKFWLYSLVMNLVRDFYEILNILNSKAHSVSSYDCVRRQGVNILSRWLSQNKSLALDTLKNGCDFFIPFSALGYMSLSPGVVGFLGVVSSIAGIVPLVDASYRLSPC